MSKRQTWVYLRSARRVKLCQLNAQKLSSSVLLGLDPAKPYFEGTNPHCRLDKNDAQFVDVIHTDIYQAGTHEEVRSILWIVSFFSGSDISITKAMAVNQNSTTIIVH